MFRIAIFLKTIKDLRLEGNHNLKSGKTGLSGETGEIFLLEQKTLGPCTG